VRREHLLGIFYLSFATLLWSTTFVVLKDSLLSLSAAQITLMRFVVATLCFVPFLLRRDWRLWAAGLELGAYLFLAYMTQAIGLGTTSANRSAFITTLYVVLLPVLLGLLGQRLRFNIWLAAGLAIVGVGLLSYDGSPPNRGDFWTLGTALAYTVYIWRMEPHAARFAALPLTGIQMLAVLAASLLWVAWERPVWNWEAFPWASVLYLGLVASAFCVWLQALGQKFVAAPEAAVIYTLEPVYVAVMAYFLLHERLGIQGLIGAALVVVATLVSQLRNTRPHAEQITPES